jgi:phage terminase large subunit-like protein
VGFALLGDLWKEFKSGIRAYLPQVDKESRFAAKSAKIESGLILLPKDAAWLGPFKHELMAFPNGRHDDQVDSVAQFLDWTSQRFATNRIQAAIQGVPFLRRDPIRR